VSLVGPRPCIPSQYQLIIERLRLGVYDAKPGITGYAQVRGIDMSMPVQLALADQTYFVALQARLYQNLKNRYSMVDPLR
jgi:O-antigen biosynthesis protein WbqP